MAVVNASVSRKPDESINSMLRRFSNECERYKVDTNIRRYLNFESKSRIKALAKRRAIARYRKIQEAENKTL